jgi:biotin transport system substrate-specific component
LIRLKTPKLNPEGINVSKELSAKLAPLAAPAESPWLRATGILLGGSALAAICAHVCVPLYFTPVPLSLAPFAVLILGLLLSPRMAAATFGAYLAEGALGLPVFAPSPLAPGGLAHLFGPTGGYLLAYPLAAALISYFFRRTGRGFSAALLSAAVGDFAILAVGGLWLAILTHASAQSVLTLAVLPFLAGDALKVAAAAALAIGSQRLRRHNP